MNKLTTQELSIRQSYTLHQKIDHSLGVIDKFLSEYPNSVVSFSGGIDSTVMLFLVRMLDKNRKALFAHTTNEFSDIVRFVKETSNVDIVVPKINFKTSIERYGFPLISKKVCRMIHDVRYPTDRNKASRNLYLTGIKRDGTKSTQFIIPQKYRHLIDAPFDITNKCCDILKKNPMKSIGKEGVFVGTMAENSHTRKGAYLRTGCIDYSSKICKPMSIWLKEDVWKFVKENNLKYSTIYNTEKNTGCAYCGNGCQFDTCRFQRLRKLESSRFDLMMSVKNNGVTFEDALRYTFKDKIYF